MSENEQQQADDGSNEDVEIETDLTEYYSGPNKVVRVPKLAKPVQISQCTSVANTDKGKDVNEKTSERCWDTSSNLAIRYFTDLDREIGQLSSAAKVALFIYIVLLAYLILY